MEDKKAKTVLHGFVEILSRSKRKQNKLWVDQGKGFHNSPMQKWLDDNDILMYSTHNEGKSVVAERFTRTLTSKNYKKVIANNKKPYLGYLNKLLDEYNNIGNFIGKNSVDTDYSTLTKEIDTNPISPKFKVGNRVRIIKYKNIFSKGCTKN